MRVQNKFAAPRYRLLYAASIITGIGLFSFSFSFAEQSEIQNQKRAIKGISGEVSAISKDFIAVVYRNDQTKGSEEEIALPIAKYATVEHKRSLSEIVPGDLVDVEFEEYTEETPQGSRSKRVAVVVRFLKAGNKPAEIFTFSGEEKEAQE